MRTARRLRRHRRDDGYGLIGVLGVTFLLSLITVTLLQVGQSEYGQASYSDQSMRARVAAEAGINAYLSYLIQRNDFDTKYMAPGEMPRQYVNDPMSGIPTDSTCDGTSDTNELWATNDLASLRPVPANMSNWKMVCDWDAGTPVQVDAADTADVDRYVYALAVFPRAGNDLRVVAHAWRQDSAPGRGPQASLEVTVRPSSFAKYQMISDADIYVNPGTTTSGQIYSKSKIYHNGTAANWVIAEQGACFQQSPTCTSGPYGSLDQTTWTAEGLLANCTPTQAFFEPGWASTSCHNLQRAGKAPDTANLQTAFDNVRTKVQGGGGMNLSTGQVDMSGGWRGFEIDLTGGGSGNVAAHRCRERSSSSGSTASLEVHGDLSVAQEGTRHRGAGFYNYFENGIECETATVKTMAQGVPFFVYSDYPLVVHGNVVGRGNIVSAEDVYLGGNITYGSTDSGSDLDNYVLGLHAKGEVIVPAWVATTASVRAATIAQEGSYHDSQVVQWYGQAGQPCASNTDNVLAIGQLYCLKSALTFNGSWYSKKPANVTTFLSREYAFYRQLEALAPPLWPNATNQFDVVRWRELKGSYDLPSDSG